MKEALLRLFKSFKFARKKLGGTWYYIEMIDSAAGVTGPIRYWTQRKPDDPQEILKKEEYK